MESTPTLTFDLLPLSWWQNPWYYVAFALASILAASIALFWYYKNRRVLTPEEKIILKLKKLQSMPRATQPEQKVVYELLIQLIKEYVALFVKRTTSFTLGLTDQELMHFVQTQAPENFLVIVERIVLSGNGVKFAGDSVQPAEIQEQMSILQQVLEQLEHEKKLIHTDKK